MAKGTLIANTTVNFSDGTENQGIRLVEDSEREVEATTRTTQANITVSCTNKKFIRLYPPATGTTKVVAATGSLSFNGSAIEIDATDVLTFSPDSQVAKMSRGVENVRIEMAGTAFDRAGEILRVSVTYDQVRRELRVSEPCYCVVKIRYDAPYSLYMYTFAGACPDTQPAKFDGTGNSMDALSMPTIRYFEEGLISAIDPAYGAYTSLTLEAPECSWSGISINFADSDRDKVVPTLKMEIDPDYPPRLVNAGSSSPVAECCIRIYPAGAASQVVSTSGMAVRVSSFTGLLQVSEVKQFTNSAVAALDYPPAGTISAAVLGTAQYLGGSSGGFVRGPGETVTDVTYVEGGNGRYTDPRPRTLGSNEVAMVDLFGHPVPCHGLVKVDYSTTYDRYVFTFTEKAEASGGVSFTPAYVVASDSLGRAANLKVDPPSLRDKTKSMRG